MVFNASSISASSFSSRGNVGFQGIGLLIVGYFDYACYLVEFGHYAPSAGSRVPQSEYCSLKWLESVYSEVDIAPLYIGLLGWLGGVDGGFSES